MDPIVSAACDLAVSSAFGGGSCSRTPSTSLSYRPIGAAANTAFSGSAVLELEVTVDVDNSVGVDRVVLKHSSVRKLAFSEYESSISKMNSNTSDNDNDNDNDTTTSTTTTTQSQHQNNPKYAAAIKVDKSSRNEYAFLQAYWELLLTKNSNKTRIPRVLFARDHPREGVTLLLESLSSFGSDTSASSTKGKQNSKREDSEQTNDSSSSSENSNASSKSNRIHEIPLGPKTDAALEWLANFHAAFFPKSLNPNAFDVPDHAATASTTADHEHDNDTSSSTTTTTNNNNAPFTWSVGTHLSLEKRSPTELQNLPEDLSAFLDRFESTHRYFHRSNANSASRKQGQRIRALAKGVAATLHPDHECNRNRRTMVHGDYKQGNMFFANNDANSKKDTNDDNTIAVFDWQWTGPGIGATDLVYLCVMAVSDEALEDHEANILKPYHNYLTLALERGRRASNTHGNNIVDDYPYHELLNEFKLAAIDMQRWLAGSRYKSMTLDSVRKAKQTIDVNHGIFRRSIERLVWIFQTVDDALDDVESGRIPLVV